MSRYVIISADCHAGLPSAEYRPYLEKKYHAAFDTALAEIEAMRVQMAQAAGMMDQDFATRWEAENEEGLRGGWDASRRDKELDADGVAGEVIFPNADAVTGKTSAPFGAGLGMTGHDPELLLAGARAHNRWLSELCTASPDRRAGVALVPILDDPVAAAAEIRSAHESGLRGGILIANMWGDHPPYHDARYDPVWAVCQELRLPIHTHSGSASSMEYGDNIGIYITEVTWWAARPLWFLLWSGVFERFPELRFVVTEATCSWVPELLWRMDTAYVREHGSKKLGKSLERKLTMLPSEYFDRNCWIGASTTKRREIAHRYEIGVENIMWGNDFPHPEGTWPHTVEWLRKTFHDIPEDETRQMLGLNAATAYGFDLKALAPVVDRIGPTAEVLGQDGSDTSVWDEARMVGRHWRTDHDPRPVGPRV